MVEGLIDFGGFGEMDSFCSFLLSEGLMLDVRKKRRSAAYVWWSSYGGLPVCSGRLEHERGRLHQSRLCWGMLKELIMMLWKLIWWSGRNAS